MFQRNCLGLVFVLVIWCNVPAANALDKFLKLCNVQNFEDFLSQTGKAYDDPAAYSFRESIFVGKKSVVDLTNKNADLGTSPYRLTINPFADMTKQEVLKLTASKITGTGENITVQHTNFVTERRNIDNLPDSYDWRELGGVTPPGFQGFTCGSCWSFATIGAVEGHLFRRTGVLVPLSPQNLVDCAEDYGCTGCDGGFQEYAFEYIRDHGISLENKYPLTQDEDGECHINEINQPSTVRIRDYAAIRPGDEEKMKEVIATLGPIACSINAGEISFEQYMGGIYDDDKCNQDEVNHSILVVGYGNEGGRDYWIIKNSYSENWGENGFMRLPRNEGSFCGIASECSYPVM